MAVRVFDLADGVPQFAPDPARRWYVLVLDHGSPIARFEMPTLDDPSHDLMEAAVVRQADREVARRALLSSLRQRLGPPLANTEIEHLTCSVVVCTHRRPGLLATLLAALVELDPQPEEIIVVDNDPGAEDCRAEVEAVGARYVREDRRGLDNARNAGIRAARGRIVVFTDDDCVPPRHWLRSLSATFAEPAVVAVTGPAFPYALDTPSRLRMEQQASLARGLRRTAYDWASINPCHAGAVGVGANMAFLRDALESLGDEPFPPELDAGTPTESGGDTYVLARLLAKGDRVLYEPDMFVFHQHRADALALHRAVTGYGTGVSAALSKLLVEDRESAALIAWTWLLKQYARALGRRLLGRGDAESTRIAADYLRGGLLGFPRWRTSLAHQRGLSATSSPAEIRLFDRQPSTSEISDGMTHDAEGQPELTIVIPTDGKRGEALARCVTSLAPQARTGFCEIILVDDATVPSVSGSGLARGGAVRTIATGGLGAAAARNAGAGAARGRVVLFLDDDMVASPGLIDAHMAHHSDGVPKIVVGPYPPNPRERNLIAVAAARWWSDTFMSMSRAISHGFSSAMTGNLSIPSDTFRSLGGFHEPIGRVRREDWEWGIRARKAGIPIEFEPSAVASHEYALSSKARLAAARREGHGDWLLTERFPEAAAVLPLSEHRGLAWSEPLRTATMKLLPRAPFRWLSLVVLDAAEGARLRTSWAKLFRRLQTAAYMQGMRDAGAPQGASRAVVALDVELEDSRPIAAPGVIAPSLRITVAGVEVASVTPETGIWTPALAEQIADAVPWPTLRKLAATRGWLPPSVPSRGDLKDVEVMLDGDAAAPSLAVSGATLTTLRAGTELRGAVAAAAERAGPRLVAIPLRGISVERTWLDEAIVAFDSDQVGVLVGGSLANDEPAAVLYLSDSQRGWDPGSDELPSACFVVLRRDLAATILAGLDDALSDAAALAEIPAICTESGYLAARRDTHGLAGSLPGDDVASRGWAELVTREITAPVRGSSRGENRVRHSRQALGVLAWEVAKAITGNTSSRQLLRGAVASRRPRRP